MAKLKKLAGILLLLCMLLGFAGCGAQEKDRETDERLVIGVCAYDTSYEEMQLFMNYYREYISQGMSVDFLFSESLRSGEEERAFIRLAKEKGAEGIISFYGQDLGETLNLCQEEEIYYVLGSGTISDEDFAAAAGNPYFLGVIGPDTEEEYQAGYDMAAAFQSQGAKSWLILSGGSALGNYMHASRTIGILEAIAEREGLTYKQPVEELAVLSEASEIPTGKTGVHITICPGYVNAEEGNANLLAALGQRDYDAVPAVMSFGNELDTVVNAAEDWGHTVLTGTVDCFSEQNLEAVRAEDFYGQQKLNYVAGKYASMAGPALAAVYNAVTGHQETVQDQGGPFRLCQSLWKADSAEQYEELYGFTQGIYENAYSCDELMQVISVFHPEASFTDFAELTEASDVESVEARILQR